MAKAKGKSKKENERRPIDIDLGRSLSLKEFDYGTIEDAIEQLQTLRDQFPGKTVIMKVQGVAYCDYEEYALYERRLENDEELAARQAKEAEQQRNIEANERAHYERLRKKFGGP